MDKESIKQKFYALIGENAVLMDAPMKDQLSFRAGGKADFLLMPDSIIQLAAVLKCCKENALPFFIMGNGSNFLVRDGGFRGVIIKTRQMDHIETKDTVIRAEAGALLRKIAEVALEQGLTGLEFASGIPGTVGGAAVMNAGAYDGEMKQLISAVEAIDTEGNILHFTGDECDFGYRHSIFQNADLIITKITLQLKMGDQSAIHNRMLELNRRRREKQPLEFPSAGSTFKRPEGYFAGKLIQDAGFRGLTVGGAQLSEKHCGFVINRNNATAADILKLMAMIQEGVHAKYGVNLQPEVIVIGEEA